MVNVRKRGKVYEYSFDVAKIEGKRKRVSKSGFKTKAEALKQSTSQENTLPYWSEARSDMRPFKFRRPVLVFIVIII